MGSRTLAGEQTDTSSKIDRRSVVLGALASPFVIGQCSAAESLKAYSIWPENYARPMLEAFEKATGIHVNFIRFSSGEALARLLAEKGNPQVDVLFGGPVETFTAGEEQGIFEAYTPPSAGRSAEALQERAGHVDRDRRRSPGVHDQHQIPAGTQSAAAGLLGRSVESRLQEHAANGRCAHVRHRGDAHLLDPAGQQPQRGCRLRLHEEAAPEHSGLYQERRRRHGAGRPRAGGRRHLLHRRCAVHQAEGLRRADLLPQGRDRLGGRMHRASSRATRTAPRREN